MYLAHLSVMGLPSDGASVGRYVRQAVEILRRSGIRHEVHAMGTEVEADTIEQIFEVVRLIDQALVAQKAQRVTISLKIDHRLDKRTDLASKVRSASPR